MRKKSMRKESMRKESNRTLARLFRLGLPLVALAAAMGGGASPAASCPTCLAETVTAFTYCRNNPNGTYNGCNPQLDIVSCYGVHSANQIYYGFCPF
jgi:hypothetical protein